MLSSRSALLAAALLAACNGAEGDTETHLRPAAIVPSANAPAAEIERGARSADIRVDQEALAADRAKDRLKGDHNDAEWVAKEYSNGQAKWKDVGVYLDGKPIGFVTWGELPIALKPSWLREKVSADKRYGTNDPGWRWARKRYYKINAFLTALGVDLRAVKEVHIYGGKPSESLVLTGADLRSPLAEQLWVWFGSNTAGKPIPHVPEGLGRGRLGDKITGIMAYQAKRPPTLTEDGFVLDGVEQVGVPYYGDPVRGGVRVYLDDRLATIIKRQELDPNKAIKGADGEPEWSLAQLLKDRGVDPTKVAELWAIRGDARTTKWSGAELPTLSFQASSQSHGGVVLGAQHQLANVIALHTHALKPDELPLPEQDDE